jgi:hypothetical protein
MLGQPCEFYLNLVHLPTGSLAGIPLTAGLAVNVGTTYEYRVRSANDSAWSLWSGTHAFRFGTMTKFAMFGDMGVFKPGLVLHHAVTYGHILPFVI